MKCPRILMVTAAALMMLASSTQAQSLNKRHQLEIRMGMWNQVTDTRTEVNTDPFATSVKASGFAGGLSYGHWLQENLALNISVGAMMAEVETYENTISQSTRIALVSPVLFGLKYYFPRSTYHSSVRPFVKAAVGPYTGYQEKSESGVVVIVESRSESVMGGQLGGGVDFILGSHFLTGIAFAYNFIDDFQEPIGGSRNYSGPEIEFGLSLLL